MKRLHTIIFLWPLLVLLIILSVFNFFSYKNIHSNLYKNAVMSLYSTIRHKEDILESFFSERLKELRFIATGASNINYLKGITKLCSERGVKTESTDFLDYSAEHSELMHTYDQYEMLFIDTEGNVLLSIHGGEYSKKNIFSEHYAGTNFSASCRKALKTEYPVFSDFEPDASLKDLFVSLIQRVVDKDGNTIGLLATRIPKKTIENIVQKTIFPNNYNKVYLIGENARNQSRYPAESRHTRETEIEGDTYEVHSYLNSKNVKVLGIREKLKKLEKFGLYWSLVAESSTIEIFSPAQTLKRFFIFIFIVAGLFLVLFVIQMRGVLSEMTTSIRRINEEKEEQNWLQSSQIELHERMRNQQSINALAHEIISYICNCLGASMGELYSADENEGINIIGSYTRQKSGNHSADIMLDSDLARQAALGKKHIILSNSPTNHIHVDSKYERAEQNTIVAFPFQHNDIVKGVIEISTPQKFSESDLLFLNKISESIAMSIDFVQSSSKMVTLLEKTNERAERYKAQLKDLQTINKELGEKAKAMKDTEEILKAHQEELQMTNKELKKQKANMEQKNRELEMAQKLVIEKARDLEKMSKYKAEFLANMSHELRTPLNSALLLSKLLSENKEGNLTEKQVQFCQIINSASSDLLAIINDILDLSKAEAGKIELCLEDVDIAHFATIIVRNFKPIAQEKGLALNTHLADDLPPKIRTDRQRMEQIIKNLLSNAFKFTYEGVVQLRIRRPKDKMNVIAFSILDTGIGIPEDKQKLIFEAFQQVDGTISKEYGGTGLGLSISREYAKLLGGEIEVESEEGKGSIFTLYIPEKADILFKQDANRYRDGRAKKSISEKVAGGRGVSKKSPKHMNFIRDDRRKLSAGDKSVLVIQNNLKLAKILQAVSGKKGFKTLFAEDGEMGLHLADYYQPSAIILDRAIPGMNAVAVVERLKNNPKTRHIPVYFISDFDEPSEIRRMGAIGCLVKPISLNKLKKIFLKIEDSISKNVKNILVVENDKSQRSKIEKLLRMKDIRITSVDNGGEAYEQLKSGKFDCLIQDLQLPDISGVELLATIRNEEDLIYIPIIIYTAKKLTKKEEILLNQYAEKIILKGTKSPERLLDETVWYLHRTEANLSEKQRNMLGKIYNSESILKNKKILLVDDDMRNVFAITNLLEENGMNILVGRNGKEGLTCLNNNPDIDLVLMDILMPVMNGYLAMKEIRKQKRFQRLPIIALTARAMRGDRLKCIEAGANDYLAKPIDTKKLLSMLRVWLY
ncbi:MAG: response regulator [bacterium]